MAAILEQTPPVYVDLPSGIRAAHTLTNLDNGISIAAWAVASSHDTDLPDAVLDCAVSLDDGRITIGGIFNFRRLEEVEAYKAAKYIKTTGVDRRLGSLERALQHAIHGRNVTSNRKRAEVSLETLFLAQLFKHISLSDEPHHERVPAILRSYFAVMEIDTDTDFRQHPAYTLLKDPSYAGKVSA